MENLSGHEEEQEKGFINWEYVAKGIIVTIACLGIGGIILVLTCVTVTTPFLKVCLGGLFLIPFLYYNRYTKIQSLQSLA